MALHEDGHAFADISCFRFITTFRRLCDFSLFIPVVLT